MAMNTDEFDFIWVWLDRVQKPLQFLIADPEFGCFISRGNIRMYLLKKFLSYKKCPSTATWHIKVSYIGVNSKTFLTFNSFSLEHAGEFNSSFIITTITNILFTLLSFGSSYWVLSLACPNLLGIKRLCGSGCSKAKDTRSYLVC